MNSGDECLISWCIYANVGATQETSREHAVQVIVRAMMTTKQEDLIHSKGPRNDFGLLVRAGFSEEMTWQQRSESEDRMYWAERQIRAISVSNRKVRGENLAKERGLACNVRWEPGHRGLCEP